MCAFASHCRAVDVRRGSAAKEVCVRLLIAIPVFNERQYVCRVLDKIRHYARDILCIDDGSTDGTGELLAGLAGKGEIKLIRHETNRGYGQSLIDAFNFAAEQGYDWVITMDCDEQHEPERIPDFVREIEADRWDLISGSRYLQGRADDDLPPGDRRAINATITSLINELFHWELTDAFCGFKAHLVEATQRLKLDELGYAFPLQLWPRVAKHGLRVKEIPVRLIYNDPNRHFGGQLDDSSVRLKHYLAVLNRELGHAKEAAGRPGEQAESGNDDSEPVCSCCACE
jgi:glycosyltransferase involved in cell wall biosynthesis